MVEADMRSCRARRQRGIQVDRAIWWGQCGYTTGVDQQAPIRRGEHRGYAKGAKAAFHRSVENTDAWSSGKPTNAGVVLGSAATDQRGRAAIGALCSDTLDACKSRGDARRQTKRVV